MRSQKNSFFRVDNKSSVYYKNEQADQTVQERTRNKPNDVDEK